MLRRLAPILIAATFCVSLLATGCADHRGYYDSYNHQRYPYAEENPHYQQWESETHRSHEDLNKRSKSDQKEYWDWRNKDNKGHDHDQNSH